MGSKLESCIKPKWDNIPFTNSFVLPDRGDAPQWGTISCPDFFEMSWCAINIIQNDVLLLFFFNGTFPQFKHLICCLCSVANKQVCEIWEIPAFHANFYSHFSQHHNFTLWNSRREANQKFPSYYLVLGLTRRIISSWGVWLGSFCSF